MHIVETGQRDVLHRVVHREAGGDHAAGAVDVDLDVLLGILALEEQELRDDCVRDEVVDLGPDEDDAILQQAAEDVPLALAAVGHLGDGGEDVGALAQAVLLALEELHRLRAVLDSSALSSPSRRDSNGPGVGAAVAPVETGASAPRAPEGRAASHGHGNQS